MGAVSDFMGLRIPVAAGAALMILAWLWARRRAGQIEAMMEPEIQPERPPA
jgi:hypothetical protein